MPATSAPFGMRPIFHMVGQDRAQRFVNAIPSGYGFNIFKYQPVALSNGAIVPAALTGADWIGVFAGVMFHDAFGRPNFVNNWVASTTLGTGDLWAFVWTFDQEIVYEVQADGPIPQTAIGDQADFAASMLTGSTLTGLSDGMISATLAGVGGQGMVRIIDLQPRPDNAWGDAFTIVQVQNARSQYVANKVAV